MIFLCSKLFIISSTRSYLIVCYCILLSFHCYSSSLWSFPCSQTLVYSLRSFCIEWSLLSQIHSRVHTMRGQQSVGSCEFSTWGFQGTHGLVGEILKWGTPGAFWVNLLLKSWSRQSQMPLFNVLCYSYPLSFLSFLFSCHGGLS